MVKMFHIVIINHFEDSDEHLLKDKYEIALFRWITLGCDLPLLSFIFLMS